MDPEELDATEDAGGSATAADEPEHPGLPDALEGDVEVLEAGELTPEEGPAEFTEVPDAVVLNGRVLVLPNEPAPPQGVAQPGSEEHDAHAHEDDAHEGEIGGALVVTDEGRYVPVDPASFGAALHAGADFAGTATLSGAARAAVEEQLEAEGSLTDEEVLETAAAAAGEAGEELAVTGATAVPSSAEQIGEGLQAAAPAKRAHTADVVYFTSSTSSYNSRNFTEAQLRSLVTQSGTYWNGQSNGAVTGISVARYQQLNADYVACSQSGLWSQAAASYGANANTYTNGRHLIVFVETSTRCLQAGLADIGNGIHAGGVIWVDLSSSIVSGGATQTNANRSLAVLAHEVGHNLSLGHAQSRVCTNRTVDARTAWYADEQNPDRLQVRKPSGSPCWDSEYGDTWSLMGAGGSATTQPTALGIAQRTALGVNPSGSLRTVQAKNGRVQTFELNPIGSTAGLRGLRITNPTGEDFYVEYRSGGGQDSQQLGGASYIGSYDGSSAVSTGLQITKSYPSGLLRWDDGVWRSYPVKRSTAIAYWKTSGDYSDMKHLNLKKDASSTPIDSIARVKALGFTGGKAQVQVTFVPFIDVPYNHQFGKEINWMSSEKLSTGINAGSGLKKYAPKSNVTREAMAAFLYRLNAPKGYTAPKTSPFADVKPGQKFYKEISWMYQQKLSTGVKQKSGKPKFMPKSSVTREAMAAFIYRMEKASYKGAKTSQFADVKRGQKFYKEISWMYQSGLSTGVKQKSGKPKYLPKNSVSREAMAAFIYRLKN